MTLTIDFADTLPAAPPEACAVALLRPAFRAPDPTVTQAAAAALGLPPALVTEGTGCQPIAGPIMGAQNAEGSLNLAVFIADIGAPSSITLAGLEDAAGRALQAAGAAGFTHLILVLPDWPGMAVDSAVGLTRAGLGACLAAHPADPLRDRSQSGKPAPLTHLTLVGTQAPLSAALWPKTAAEIAAVTFARDLVNRPSNEKRPDRFAADLEALRAEGLTTTILAEETLAELGAGALLAVGRASTVPARLVYLDWNGTGDDASPTIALIGKGVTFDTGGITLKRPHKMWDMRQDMAGAAAVAGAMLLLAKTKAPVRVTALIPLAENMIGGNAFRPGDIVTALDGTTIEIRDTDAEGRLALADAIAFARESFDPLAILAIATLTGSVTAALGRGFAGVFADDAVLPALTEAAANTRARLWRLPFDSYFASKLVSDIADICQVGPDEERADTCFAAAFLKRFAGDTPLGHIDTATQHWAEEPHPLCPFGATGFGVTLLADAAQRLWHHPPQ